MCCINVKLTGDIMDDASMTCNKDMDRQMLGASEQIPKENDKMFFSLVLLGSLNESH